MAQTYDLYVGSLPTGYVKTDVEELFDSFGPIKLIRIIQSSGSGPNLAIAFIHYEFEEHALNAIKDMNGYVLCGMNLKVRKSDKWLKRIGEYTGKPMVKGTQQAKPFGKPVTKQSNNNYGLWMPPNTDSDNVHKGESSTLSSVGSNNSLFGSQSQNAPGCYPHQKSGIREILSAQKKARKSCKKSRAKSKKCRKESVAVTHVEDPVSFFAYYTNRSMELQDLSAELQEVCPRMCSISTAPCSTQVYGSLYSADENWYRCKVLSTDNHLSRSLIQYIDFGNLEKVNNSNLIELPENLRKKAPLAVKFVLQNLQPKAKHQDNYEESLEFLKENLIDQMVSLEMKQSSFGDFMEVSKLFKNGTELTEIMVSKGYLKETLDQSMAIPAVNVPQPRASQYINGQLMDTDNGRLHRGSTDSVFPAYHNYQEINPSTSSNYSNYHNHESKMLQLECQKLKVELEKYSGRNKALQEEFKRQQKPNIFAEMPHILSDLKKASLLRQQLPVHPDSLDYIEKAVQLLTKEELSPTPFDQVLRTKTQELVDQYTTAQLNIINCKDRELLNGLIEERDTIRKSLHTELTSFCSAIHSNALNEKVEAYEVSLSGLKKVYHSFLGSNISTGTDLSLGDLYTFYSSAKEEKTAEFLEVQIQTDLAQKAFFDEIHLGSLPLGQVKERSISVSKTQQTLEHLKFCLANEIATCTLEDSEASSIVGMITKLLCEKLESGLAVVHDLGGLEKQYSSLLQQMSPGLDGPAPDMQDLATNRKGSKKLRSQLRHALADKKDLEEEIEDATEDEVAEVNKRLSEVRLGLHESFLEEDRLISSAAALQESAYPELNILFPDLGLQNYSKYKGLVKVGLELEHFDLESLPSVFPSEVTYASKFHNKPIRLKEYHVGNEIEKEAFLQLILQYSELIHESLLPIDAVFFTEKSRSAYVQQPLLTSLQTYVEESKAMEPNQVRLVLQDLLSALDVLHRQGSAHGRLHPGTVFLTPDLRAVLDSVNFSPSKSSASLPCVNGLRFQLPSTNGKSNSKFEDVYSLACLMLWLLCPSTQFQVDHFGATDLTPLKLKGPAAQLLATVRSVLERPVSQYPLVGDLLLHPTFNQELASWPPTPSEDASVENPLDLLPGIIPSELLNSQVLMDGKAEEVYYSDQNAEENGLVADFLSETEEDVVESPPDGEEVPEEESETHEENNVTFQALRQTLCSLTNDTPEENIQTLEAFRQSLCSLTLSSINNDDVD